MTGSVFDADGHVMEIEQWLPQDADNGVRDRLYPLGLDKPGACR